MGVIYGITKSFIFKAAVQFLTKKTPLPAEEYKAMSDVCQVRAFTVSGYASIEVLQSFLDTLKKSVEEGQTKEQFQKEMNQFLELQGYEKLNPWKSDLIFRNNVQSAFQAGHYKSMSDPTTKKMRPYWQYQTAGDGKVRDTHAAMAGKVYAADDPIWNIWYPPNGHKCRCSVVSLSRQQVQRRGLHVEQSPPETVDMETGEIKMVMPDKGFSNNPAKDAWKPDTKELNPILKQAYKERKTPDGTKRK